MSNSILSSLPTLHATMLSIIMGFFTAYFLYAYQKTNTAIENIELLKRHVQNISQPSYRGGIDYTDYLNDSGFLDWQHVKDELWEIASIYSDLDSERYEHTRQTNPVDKTRIEEAGRKLSGLTGLISSTYPYSEEILLKKKKIKKEVNTTEWIETLSRQNTYLVWLWESYSRGLNELMEQFRIIDVENQKERNEKDMNKNIADMERNGDPLTQEEIAEIKNKFHKILEIDYGYHLRDFFSKVNYIGEKIIPQIGENQIVLESHLNKFKIKKRSLWILALVVFIFIFGIIVPLIISAYTIPPIMKSLEITLLVLTTAPYLFGLFYFMSIVSSFNHQ